MSNYKKGIIKHAGQVNRARLADGREIERTEWLFWRDPQGQFASAKAVPDQDHFLYQNVMPIPDDILITKYNGVVPENMRGDAIMCTCGSPGVVFTDGPYRDMAICRFYMQFGVHQTSAKIENGKLTLPKQIESNFLADNPGEIVDSENSNNRIKIARKY